ncbi:hypothetical protein OPQ81_003781 [Rhizoctonia solani]|nr:hypothetical protein OPQ81_003781 [Rhizoctonia solani]
MERPPKRRRMTEKDGVDDGDDDLFGKGATSEAMGSLPHSLSRPISPPRRKSRPQSSPPPELFTSASSATRSSSGQDEGKVFKSPFQLTWIRDLPDAANKDAVTLRDLLGDPLIAEVWEFNYLHDIEFLISAFDEDVRDLVQVHLVHGFWKREDRNRLLLEEQARAHENVTLHCAFMPEMFGTHHCKMLILLRRDDTAQVIIHTANMIARDWTNMTQSVWRSPMLPLKMSHAASTARNTSPVIGSGEKFKVDLLNYLCAYNQRRPVCRELVEKLDKYDFSAIRAALIASVPGRHNIHDATEATKWGWAALKSTLQQVHVQDGKSEVVVQVSSIATLGPTDSWLRRSLCDSLKASKDNVKEEPRFKVVFPTPDEIRRSLDGYESGASIHTKIQSAQQAKQLLYLMPIFHHWANDAGRGQALEPGAAVQEAGRKRAAPHIKIYIRYGERTIDWALITSANLSKQAWGEAANSSGEVRIASWEIGVLVWPSLFADDAIMVGTFGKDTPDRDDKDDKTPVVGLRIPYNMPLQPYGEDERPWVATTSHTQPDWKGQKWVT